MRWSYRYRHDDRPMYLWLTHVAWDPVAMGEHQTAVFMQRFSVVVR